MYVVEKLFGLLPGSADTQEVICPFSNLVSYQDRPTHRSVFSPIVSPTRIGRHTVEAIFVFSI